MFAPFKKLLPIIPTLFLLAACSESGMADGTAEVASESAKEIATKTVEAAKPMEKITIDMSMSPELSGVYTSADEVQPLLPGQKTPSFTVQTVAGERFTYQPKQHEKPVVLTFYRGGWCPYCNLHLSEMRNAEAELKEKGFDVWFISIDSPEMLYESLKNPDVGYIIYSDAELEATRAFRIGFKVDDKTLVKYEDFGIDLEKASGKTHHVLPAPATFILGTDGKIQFQYVNPDYSIRLAPEVLLAAADAYTKNAQDRMKRK